MPIDGIPTAATGPAATQPKTPPAGNSTDKDSFLKLLMAQLEHQDPLKPMEGTEFVSQLAQFTQVEQSIRQNDALDVISLQLTGMASNGAISLVGKNVTVRGSTIAFDGQKPTGFSANLESPAADVKVTIRDGNGNAVREIEMGAQQPGTLTVPWDGRDETGRLVMAGSYHVEIDATDANGDPVHVTSDVDGKVIGVSFEKGYPEVQLDSGATAPISDLIKVTEPDDKP